MNSHEEANAVILVKEG